ncbi:hypothetical protein [Roseiflexus sp.]
MLEGSEGEVHYLVYRSTLRDGRIAILIWRETSDWTEDDYRCDLNFVVK